MTVERKLRILRNSLDTIASEANEPIIRVYAQSALDETVDIPQDKEHNAHCAKHNWYGAPKEPCPLCTHSLSVPIDQEGRIAELEKLVEDAFNESRLTHPMVGFKHDSFQDYLKWKQKKIDP